MILEPFNAGPLDTVCYLVGDESAGEAMVVDAPKDVSIEVLQAAGNANLKIILIVNTHGHWDHIADNAPLQEATKAPIAIHPLDEERIRSPGSAMMQIPFEIKPTKAGRHLKEGDVIKIGKLTFKVLHTPGHSPGGICLYEPKQGVLLSGDTLFAGSYGRTDLPGADPRMMESSLKRLSRLPPHTSVFPGHGPSTSIGQEPWIASPFSVNFR